MKIANLKIGTRLNLGFGVVLSLLVACIALGVANMAGIQAMLLAVTNDNNVKIAAAEKMSRSQLAATIAAANVILLTDPAAMEEESRKVAAARQSYAEASEVLHRLVKSDAGKAILAKTDAAAAVTRPLNDKARKLGLENKRGEATKVLVDEVAPAAAKWQAGLEEVRQYQVMRIEELEAGALATYANARLLMLTLGTLALAAGAFVAWFATRSIVVPLLEAVRIANTVASGDLSSEIEVTSSDETGQLLAALKKMNTSLQEIVGRVRSGTETVATASSQIASGNLELSSRTEQQASSLEETASSMEELASTVKQNADNARQADGLATAASEVAVKGGKVVAEVVDTMGSIHESSRKIVDIISVIDGIAFQTNILALNAAVEAARAGEQGRGFAVVASEVRNLAQRSAAAAKEIKLLIDDSVSKVATGSTLVRNAGVTMEELVASVKRVSDIMAEISAAGREQELGIGQINQAVIEMDTVTQQNAALVEEASAAAESLMEQATGLTETVSFFRLSSVASGVRHGAAARPAPVLSTVTALPAARRTEPAPSRAPARKKIASGSAVSLEWEEF